MRGGGQEAAVQKGAPIGADMPPEVTNGSDGRRLRRQTSDRNTPPDTTGGGRRFCVEWVSLIETHPQTKPTVAAGVSRVVPLIETHLQTPLTVVTVTAAFSTRRRRRHRRRRRRIEQTPALIK